LAGLQLILAVTVVAAAGAAFGVILLVQPGSVDEHGLARTGGPVVALIVVAVVVGGVAYAFVSCASLSVALLDVAGRRATVSAGLRIARRRLPRCIGVGLLALVLTGVGYILLIAPGIYLGVVFGAALLGTVVVEGEGIARSLELVRGRWWATCGRLFFASLASWAYQIVCQFALTFVVFGVEGVVGSDSVVSTIALTITWVLALPVVWLPLSVIGTAVSVVTYAELRGHERPGLSVAVLAAQMDN